MNQTIITTIGLLAGILTTFAQLPQISKMLKTKSTADISYGMYLMLITGVALWIVYGIFIGSFPVMITNIVAFCLVSLVIIFKFRYESSSSPS